MHALVLRSGHPDVQLPFANSACSFMPRWCGSSASLVNIERAKLVRGTELALRTWSSVTKLTALSRASAPKRIGNTPR
jgi:hypothetical protein